MLGEELSRALSDISDDKIEAAAGIEPKSLRHIWVRVASVAAVVALVIGMTVALWPQGEEPGEQLGMPTVGTTVAPTQPDVTTLPTETKGYELIKVASVLKLYAHDNKNADVEELKKYEMTDTIETYKTALVPMSDNMGMPLPFLFQFPEEYYGDADISFYISPDYGYVHWDIDRFDGFHNELKFENGDCIYWSYSSMREATSRFGSKGNFYVNIIIYADDRIVGYGIIDFTFYDLKTEESMLASFVTTGFTTACFPMVDGEYQNVTEEYVWEEIEAYKQMKAELEGM